METAGGTEPAPQASVNRSKVALALSGIVAVVLVTSMIVVLAALRPGYSHVADVISVLGALGTPNALFMNITFVVTGVLFVALAVGLHRGIGGGKGSRVGPALVAVTGGLGLVGIAIFPLDLEDPGAFTNTMHGLLALGAIFAPFTAAALVLSRRLRREDAWEGLASYSLVSGVALVLVIVVGLAVVAPLGFAGASQRVAVAILLLWIVVLSIRLLRRSLSPSLRQRDVAAG